MGNRQFVEQADWRPSEIGLLELVSRGYENKEIAAAYGISVTAVRKRLSRLMKLFGVANRASLVRAAFVAGLISQTSGLESDEGKTERGARPQGQSD